MSQCIYVFCLFRISGEGTANLHGVEKQNDEANNCESGQVSGDDKVSSNDNKVILKCTYIIH